MSGSEAGRECQLRASWFGYAVDVIGVLGSSGGVGGERKQMVHRRSRCNVDYEVG